MFPSESAVHTYPGSASTTSRTSGIWTSVTVATQRKCSSGDGASIILWCRIESVGRCLRSVARLTCRVLSGECLDNRLGDRVGVLVEHEVAAVEIAQLGHRHRVLHRFRGRRHHERIIAPPDD